VSRCGGALLLAVLAAGGCRSVPHVAHAPELPSACATVAFVADGAGGFGAASNSLRDAARQTGTPVQVVAVPWTHGYARVLADVLDTDHMRRQGRELAAEVLRFRAAHPETTVHLVGHSAGCQVTLAAAEALPPGSVERVVLLLPAVATDYDLRPTLACARDGVDAFHSEQDVVYLGVWTRVLGTADGRRRTPAAGRVGFRPVICSPADAALYTKLRQHPWHPSLTWTGHHGGHYGVYSPGYLQTFVLPLLGH
jgi:pimeloyl-ACP methyl ester carboxylesterase